MAPDVPPAIGLPAPETPPDEATDSRAERRRARLRESKRRHRWRRRTLYALAFVVLLAAIGAGSVYVYASYRFDQIKKVHAKHLVSTASVSQQPFNLLLVGSDTRSFVQNATQANAFGSQGITGGQRSDVTMVARFDPAAKTVTVLSIPRDLWVDIPGNTANSGWNRINAAYNDGPDLLIETIEQVLGIAVNHYMAVDFPGFSGMVDALGGITMNFPTPVKDAYTGLDVTTTGCQAVNGTTALELVRSRHLAYLGPNGYWQGDGLSDFSRIQRQDAFFRAVLAKLNAMSLNPFTINAFIGAAVGNLTIDDTFTKADMFSMAQDFRGISSAHLVTETLPTTSFTTDGGAAVLKPAEPYAQQMIDAFNQIGTTTTTNATAVDRRGGAAPSAGPTTVPTEAHHEVGVTVLNASTLGGIAHTTASALGTEGFRVTGIGDASAPIPAGWPSQIHYGPSDRQAAVTLAAALSGPVSLVPDAGLSGQNLVLLVAGAQLTVGRAGATPGAASTRSSVPVLPTTPTTTTTTTIPGDVYANTQSEPWNPSPCTLGQPSAPGGATTTTVKAVAGARR